MIVEYIDRVLRIFVDELGSNDIMVSRRDRNVIMVVYCSGSKCMEVYGKIYAWLENKADLIIAKARDGEIYRKLGAILPNYNIYIYINRTGDKG